MHSDRLKYMVLDGPTLNPNVVIKGDRPAHIDSSMLDLVKARNLSNLTPVRRQIVRRDGVVYTKTVYVKKEEASPEKSARFIAQMNAEGSLRVGDKVEANFKGWSSGAQYTFDDFVVKEINDDHVVLKFASEFRTNNRNNYVYRPDDDSNNTVKIPKTSNKDWSIATSFKRKEQPQPQVQPTTTSSTEKKPVEAIDEISVGDTVTTTFQSQEVEGEIAYIHPRGDFIDVKYGDRRLRRRLGRIHKYVVSSTATAHQNYVNQINTLRVMPNVIVSGSILDRQETRHPTETIEEPYEVWLRVDRFGNPNRRGRSRRREIRHRTVRRPLREDEMNIESVLQLHSDKLEKFKSLYKNIDLVELARDITETVNRKYPGTEPPRIRISFNSDHEGFGLNVSHSKFEMTRRFRYYDPERSGSQITGTNVYHAYFTARDQGNGLGKELFKALYKQYRKAQLGSISVSANISVGGYAWGRYGFTADKRSAESYARRFRNKVGDMYKGYIITQQDADQADRVVREWYRTHSDEERFPMNLLCSIGENNKAGKAVMLNTNWSGQLDLTNTEQRTYFENYIGFSE